ncbi:MAG: tetratricopeptide repeat protein [PVC group bacterium]
MGDRKTGTVLAIFLLTVFLLIDGIFEALAEDSDKVSFSKRVESLEKAIKADPERVENYMELAKLYAERRYGYGDSIAELSDEAIRRRPDDSKIYTAFSSLLYHCDKTRKALELARKAAELSPEDPRAHLLIGKCLERVSEDPEIAITHLREAVKLQPENDEAHYLLGKVYLSSGDPGSALDHLERAQELPTFGDNIKGYLSSFLTQAKKYTKLEKLCETGASDWDDYKKLAEYYSMCGRPDSEEEVLRKAAAHIKKPSYAYKELGHVLSRRDKYDKALEAFQEALRSASNGKPEERSKAFLIYEDIGDTYGKMGNEKEALSAYIELNRLYEQKYPHEKREYQLDSTHIHRKMGDIYFQLGKYEDALQEYKKGRSSLGKARAYRALKDYDEAIKLLWEVIKRLEKKDTGLPVDKDGEPVEELRCIISPKWYIELGKNYSAMGQNGKAMMAYWEALRLDPSSEEASTAIEELTSGKSPAKP